jgi:hypothetical protein
VKLFGYLLAALLGAALAIGVLFVRTIFQAPSSANVLVEVTNHTGQAIKEIRIEHKTGMLLRRGLADGKTITLPFAAYGEASYELHAVLADGKVLKGGIGYVESGYETKEVLEPGRVVSSYK